MEEKRYTIGQISDICNISAERLRHYDRNHILSPEVRGENNYRYYSERQIEDILLIKELKNTGLPLKTIGGLLKNKELELIKSMLEKNMLVLRQEVEEKQKSYNQLVDVMIRLNDAIEMISKSKLDMITSEAQKYDIVTIAERPIVYTRYNSSLSVNDPFIYRYTELLNIIEKENLITSRGLFLLFHDHYRKQFTNDQDAIGDLELFANITGSVSKAEHYRMFGGFQAACATHIGHYRNTGKVYMELEKWAVAQGYKVSGVSFQELIVGRTITNRESDFVTKIYLPLNIKDI